MFCGYYGASPIYYIAEFADIGKSITNSQTTERNIKMKDKKLTNNYIVIRI